MIGRQPEGVPSNRNLSTSSRKSTESWLCLAEKKRGAGASSNAFDKSCSKTRQVPTRMEENRQIPEQCGTGVEKKADGRASGGRSRRNLEVWRRRRRGRAPTGTQ
eukprot:3483179-Pleurochrysis_carterae.AAC.1